MIAFDDISLSWEDGNLIVTVHNIKCDEDEAEEIKVDVKDAIEEILIR